MARASAAIAPATSPMSAVSQVAARAIAWGKTVAPGATTPWSASVTGMRGIPRRDPARASAWTRFTCRAASSSPPVVRTWMPYRPAPAAVPLVLSPGCR